MSYWDTSALVKLYAKEPDSAAFETQAMSDASGTVTARIALYEARATFQRKEAEGILQAGAAEKLYNEMEREYGQVLTRCYGQTPTVPLRTLDALHLAAARVAGETEVVTTDKRMREAAKTLGFSLFPA
jgi:hypothetical protein